MSREKKEKRKETGRKKHVLVRIIAVLAVFAGIAMAAYPLAATWVNSRAAESVISVYNDTVAGMSSSSIEELEEQAAEYNAALAYNVSVYGSQQGLSDAFTSENSGSEEYLSLLDLDGSGVMCYIDIPSIGVYYPVFHGTSDDVLSKGIGHLSGSSLPVGGENTHAVLTGHTGITTNRLFTDLDEMSKGDMFYIHILGKVLAYEVTDIQIVLPDDTEPLLIQDGKDLVTLITCTPYGVNTHRLYVTGTRVEYSQETYEAEAKKDTGSSYMEEYAKTLAAAALLAVGIIIVVSSVRAAINKRKGKNAKIPWRGILGGLILFAGAALYAWPYVSEQLTAWNTSVTVSTFTDIYGTEDLYAEAAASGTDISETLAGTDLWDACQSYNTAIFENLQEGLASALSYEKSQITLSLYDGFDVDSAFGYIEIPAMDVTLPLYLGATTDHMALGAAVMGQTSVPIGGENTNSVIVGHRGYRGSPYFREIEKLSIGDYVYVTNPWGTLAYVVEGTDIIDPSDSESIKIQEGKDMITLLTCHPYRSHGKYRWIVYCIRDKNEEARLAAGGEKQEADSEEASVTEYIVASDGNTYTTSEADIRRENLVRQAGGIAIVLIVLLSAGRTAIRNRKQKKEKKRKQREETGIG